MTSPESACIAVCVVTYRRPDELARLLPDLTAQVSTVEGARLLIVDNDPEGSAEPIVAEVDADIGYVIEPQPGIAAARNCALREAGDAHAVVFCDDDGVPAQNWLFAITNAWRTWRPAAVTGPSRFIFSGPLDPWLKGSGVFSQPTRIEGQSVGGASSSNLLLDLRFLLDHDLAFDERFGLTGGSDTVLTHQIVAAGGTIRWAATAVMDEPVAAERATRRWAARRTLRTSNDWSRMRLVIAGSAPRRLRERLNLSARAAIRLLTGGASWCGGAVLGSAQRRGSGGCRLLSGVGMLSGAWGHVRSEYAR